MMHTTHSTLISLSVCSLLFFASFSVMPALAAAPPDVLPLPESEFESESKPRPADASLNEILKRLSIPASIDDLDSDVDTDAYERQAKAQWEKIVTSLNEAIKSEKYQEALQIIKNAEIYLDCEELPGRAEFRLTSACVLSRLAMFDKAKELFRSFFLDDKNKNLSAGPEIKIKALLELANIEIIEGKFADAKTNIDRALIQSKDTKNAQLSVASKIALANCLYEQLKLKDAKATYSEALKDARDLKSKSLEADALHGLANVEVYMGNLSVAKELIETSLKLTSEIEGKESLSFAAAQKTLAIIKADTDPTASNKLRLNALSMRIELLGTTAHPSVARGILSLTRTFKRPYSAQEAICETARNSVVGIVDAESPFMAEYFSELATVNTAQVKLKPAMEAIEKAITIQRKLYGERSLYEAESLRRTALIQMSDDIERIIATGNFDNIKCNEATASLEKAISIADEQLGPDNYKSARFMELMCSIKLLEGNSKSAEEWALKSLKIQRQSSSANDPRLTYLKAFLAKAYVKNGKMTEAKDLLGPMILQRLDSKGINDRELLKELLPEYEKAVGERTSPLEGRRLAILQKLDADDTGLNRTMLLLTKHSKGPATALKLAEKVLNDSKSEYGEDSPKLARDLIEVAGIYQSLKRFDDARDVYVRVISIQENGLGSNHPALMETLTEYAKLLDEIGMEKEADSARARCAEIKKAI